MNEATNTASTCEECCEESSTHTFITINWVGCTFKYVVPSFPVFSAMLTHMRFSREGDGNVYDGFFNNEDGAVKLTQGSTHIKASICGGFWNSFMIPCDEAAKSIEVEGNLKVWTDSVFVMWKWLVVEVNDSDVDDDVNEECGADDVSISNVDDKDGSDPNEEEEKLHTITFKCIGSNKEHQYQEVLAEMNLKRKRGDKINVRITPEPHNCFDSRAIAVEAETNSKWERVGYLVNDVLECVHKVLATNKLVSVEMSWVKFITHWSRSGPGWYCGIDICRKGTWSNVVCRCRSTL